MTLAAVRLTMLALTGLAAGALTALAVLPEARERLLPASRVKISGEALIGGPFTLVDAAGGRYPVDTETMFTHIMVLGGPELPETTVDAGTTTRGTVIFNPPSNAPTPWVIEIAPDTIATTGEQPGILVIEEPLQPYGVFGQ